MNVNQKKFLNELHELFKKYSITQVDSWEDEIIFNSHHERLCIGGYYNGTFKEITASYTHIFDATKNCLNCKYGNVGNDVCKVCRDLNKWTEKEVNND